MKEILPAKCLLVGAALESSLMMLMWFLRLKYLFIFLGFPGILFSTFLGGNLHDQMFFWLGAVISWIFWSCIFAGVIWKLGRVFRTRRIGDDSHVQI